MSTGKLTKEERRRALKVSQKGKQDYTNNGGGADGK